MSYRNAVFSRVSFGGLFLISFVSALLIGCGGRGSSDGDKNITAIAAGGFHAFALDSDGKIYATGVNLSGSLGLGDAINRDRFTAVSSLSGKKIAALVGGGSSFVITNDGKVYATGSNWLGPLGLGDATYRDRFTAVSSLERTSIIAIAAGDYHSIALDSDGKIYATGWNRSGELGLNNNIKHDQFTAVSSLERTNITAIAAGSEHSIALANDGKVYGAGSNYYGQLGLGDKTDNREVFTEITSLSDKNITAIAAGGFHAFALDSDDRVYAAGRNDHGQLGLGDSGKGTDRKIFTEVSSLSDKKITAIAAGGFHAFALDSDGKIYATGVNLSGSLGLGDAINRDRFTAVSSLSGKKIAALVGGGSSFVITNDGKVYATGSNYYGQLGLDDTTDRDVFTEVKF